MTRRPLDSIIIALSPDAYFLIACASVAAVTGLYLVGRWIVRLRRRPKQYQEWELY